MRNDTPLDDHATDEPDPPTVIAPDEDLFIPEEDLFVPEDNGLSLFTPARRAADATSETPVAHLRAAQPQRAHNRRWIIPVVILLSVALLGGGAFVFWRLHNQSTATTGAKTPTEAVQQYLDALARGDAAAALALSANKPNTTSDSSFLSDGALKTAMLANPITAINVPANQSTTTPATILASYQLGGKTVQAHFTVQDWNQAGWLLDGGFLNLDVSSLTAKGVPLTMNGIDITKMNKVQLFPGVYTLASSNPMLTLVNGSFTIEYPESNPTFNQFSFTLSEAGVAGIQAAAQAKLTQCLTSKELQPTDCGFGVDPTAYAVDPTTVTWSLANDSPDLTAITPQLDAGSYTTATAAATVTVDFQASTADHYRLVNGSSSLTVVQADFTNPDQIAIILR